jgi:hypothetical protein
MGAVEDAEVAGVVVEDVAAALAVSVEADNAAEAAAAPANIATT